MQVFTWKFFTPKETYPYLNVIKKCVLNDRYNKYLLELAFMNHNLLKVMKNRDICLKLKMRPCKEKVDCGTTSSYWEKLVKIHKFVTSTLGVHTLAPLLPFYIYVYVDLYLCVRIVFDTTGETDKFPVQNHCPFLADGGT